MTPINCISAVGIYFHNCSDKVYLMVIVIIISDIFLSLLYVHKPEHHMKTEYKCEDYVLEIRMYLFACSASNTFKYGRLQEVIVHSLEFLP